MIALRYFRIMDIDDQDSNTPLSCQEIDDFIGKLEKAADEDDEDDDIEPSLWFSDSPLDPAFDPGPLIVSEENQRFAAVHQKSRELRSYNRNKFGGELETRLLKMTLFNGEHWLCLQCQFKHSSKVGVLNHVYNYHCPDLIKCSQCPFRSVSPSELQNHARVHQVRVKPVPHRTPHETSQSHTEVQKMEPSLLQSALFIGGIGGDWRCRVCDFGPTNRDNVLNHIECFHPPAGFIGYKCTKCDLQQRCRFSLRSHMESRHRETLHFTQPVREVPGINGVKDQAKSVVYVFRCKWCKKVFSERPKLHQHLKEEHGQNSHERRRFNCSFCPYHCYSVEDIKAHLTAQHSPAKTKQSPATKLNTEPVRNFICPICSLRFKDETSYKRHIEVIEGFRFSCSLCGSVFKDEETLNFHTIYSEDCSVSGKQDPVMSLLSKPRYVKIKPKSDLTLEETCSSLIDILQNVPGQSATTNLEQVTESPEEPNMKRLKVDPSMFLSDGQIQVNDGAKLTVRDGNLQAQSNFILGVVDNQGEANVSNSVKQVALPEISKKKSIEEEKVKTHVMGGESILKPRKVEAISVKLENTDVFACKKCDEKFSQKQDLGKHLLTHLKTSPDPNIESPKHVEPNVNVSEGKQSEGNEGEISCKMCSKTFSHKTELGQHLVTHLKEGIKCTFCPATHHNIQEAQEHKKLHESSLS